MVRLVLSCLAVLWLGSSDGLLSDTSLQHEELPEIKEGDPCVPNRTYRIDCNTCRCGYNNRLFCTKMACISRDHVDKFREKVKKLAAEKEKGKEKKKNFNKKKNYQKNVNEFKLRVKDLKTSDKESEDMMVKRGKENKDNANGKNPKKTVGKGYKNKVKSNKKDVPELTEADENKDNNYKKTMRAKVDKEYESVVKINKKGLQDLHEEVENKDTNINDDKPTKVDETHKNHEKNPPDVSERDEKKDTDVKESKRTRVDEKDKSFVKNKKGLPDLPEGACVPGKFYQNECYGCYCEDTKIAVCSNKQRACEPNHRLQIPHDVRPAFTALELASLPSLPHMASRCTPGRAYRVSCNTCLCLPSRSLLCDQLLCLSQDDINRIDARKKTGTPCKNDDDIPTSSCVKCSCVDGRASCEHRIGCQLPSILRQLTKEEDGKPQMTLDVEKDKKCLPFTVYKNNCNKCYCQEDETLRCTLKVCLNYVESLKLKKHRLYLEKQGL